ncbi:MAG TPA: restriction endonuclease [Alphaproteobacteria bacterium]|nr:restriction endonuclease [Alphaproteobacteria bacterium]
MSRQNRSLLDDLAALPWWYNVILAAVVYLVLKYVLPSIDFQVPLYRGLASASPGLAPVIAGVLLLVAFISALTARKKGELLERQNSVASIENINWREFEYLVSEAYRRKGYAVTECGGAGPDGGVDLELRKNGETLFVQCKHYRIKKVGVKIIRELYGVVASENATGGIVITSGTFTQEAIDFARGNPLELVDGKGLFRLISEVQKKQKQAQHSVH